ncbi:hypothetical protein [Pseudomonas fluorescens]|uniref:Uncharacterized protein n=1 Tax=Pseudomonas fluorescens TaxID=294 RepID=A0A423LT73_PSEFL|nr:hypothetical protein [Pseudomonas fluorescens]RON71495.1 hypothetical protein BK671_04850 [Pseudomonas fluorescens]
MNRPYSLSEDEFHKLERAQESITLMSILFGEVQRSTTYTPQMIASFLDALGEDISVVIQSMIHEVKNDRFESRGASHVQ